jgi:hypothetical protein
VNTSIHSVWSRHEEPKASNWDNKTK